MITAVGGPIRQASAKAKSGSWQILWAELDKSPLDSLGLRETAYGTIRTWTRMVRVVPENHNTTPGDYDHDDPEYLCHPPTLSYTLALLRRLKARFPTAWRSLRCRLLLFFMLASKILFVSSASPMYLRHEVPSTMFTRFSNACPCKHELSSGGPRKRRVLITGHYYELLLVQPSIKFVSDKFTLFFRQKLSNPT